MSGPKVVRIVTREEIEAICRLNLREVEEAAAQLRRVAERLGCHDVALEAEITRQQGEVTKLFAAQRWMDIQKLSPMAVESMRTLADRLRAEAVAATLEQRSKGRRLADSARGLVAALEAKSLTVDPALRAAVVGSLSADADQLSQIQSILNQAVEQLQPPAQKEKNSASLKALAARLSAGDEGQTLSEWLTQSLVKQDPQNTRLDSLLAEISTMADMDLARKFTDRAASIAGEADLNRRGLLTDSLMLDVAHMIQTLRARETSLAALRSARATLLAIESDDAAALTTKVSAAIDATDVTEAEALCAEANFFVENKLNQLAAQSRRQAVLDGLAGLGYEVREAMETVWARDGRLVVRKPNSSDYGIELGSPTDASRLQIRVVVAEHPTTQRSASRDRDQEVIWCGDFDKLRTSLAKSGGVLIIDRAIEPGTQPLKTVPLEAKIEDAREFKSSLRSRSIT